MPMLPDGGSSLCSVQESSLSSLSSRRMIRSSLEGDCHEALCACSYVLSRHAVWFVCSGCTRDSLRFGSELSEAAAGYLSGRGCRRGGEFEGTRLRLFARQYNRVCLRR